MHCMLRYRQICRNLRMHECLSDLQSTKHEGWQNSRQILSITIMKRELYLIKNVKVQKGDIYCIQITVKND